MHYIILLSSVNYRQYGKMAYQSHLDKLQAIQNKFIKVISFSDKYDSSHPLFHTHSILKNSDIKLQVASFFFESKMRLSPSEFHTDFISVSYVDSYGTRQSTSEDLFQPRRLTTQYGLNTVHKCIFLFIYTRSPIGIAGLLGGSV